MAESNAHPLRRSPSRALPAAPTSASHPLLPPPPPLPRSSCSWFPTIKRKESRLRFASFFEFKGIQGFVKELSDLCGGFLLRFEGGAQHAAERSLKRTDTTNPNPVACAKYRRGELQVKIDYIVNNFRIYQYKYNYKTHIFWLLVEMLY